MKLKQVTSYYHELLQSSIAQFRDKESEWTAEEVGELVRAYLFMYSGLFTGTEMELRLPNDCFMLYDRYILSQEDADHYRQIMRDLRRESAISSVARLEYVGQYFYKAGRPSPSSLLGSILVYSSVDEVRWLVCSPEWEYTIHHVAQTAVRALFNLPNASHTVIGKLYDARDTGEDPMILVGSHFLPAPQYTKGVW